MLSHLSPITKQRVRIGLAITLVTATAIAFIFYIDHHRVLLTELRHIPLATLGWIMLLYFSWFAALMGILIAILTICRKQLGFKENLLLNAYSILTNFFIPGQGGIAVRGMYLKRRHKLKIRHYVYVMLIYYMMYAIVSSLILVVGNLPWWQASGIVAVVAAGSGLIVWQYQKRSKTNLNDLNLSVLSLGWLGAWTLLQIGLQAAIYGIELHQVDSRVGLHQIITYTGAANFSLFVAITPGAIGIRESFLLFSQRLHHIGAPTIVAASVIDRAVFLVFLGVLFVLILGLHTRYRSIIDQLRFKQPVKQSVDLK